MCDRARFPGKKLLSQKNCGNGPKKNFSEFEKKFSHSFSMNLFHTENLYYLLGSCTNTIFGKNLVPEGIGQNALSQSDCWIFKTTISPQQSDERVSIFAC